ncbi:ABA4-like family protein [Sphingosinicella rhizophila]|uniref:ABA4-like family protein n=1 Tax=Sphingosinicella rhizophila TaxID=3050082 RepID=A0ABU3Q3S1_9SPHN|nr:ABA4-like family protein [Sphingosinicella sp. GR2756]MDT9597957.1 ABA4-like family protein [Sphingosinicella sp. GR2756]
MIDPSLAFSFAGPLAIAGWLGLIAASFIRTARPYAWPAAQILIPAILACLYALLIWQGRSAFGDGGFGSLAEVRALFANDHALAAGWLHYLAFDLFVGAWIARDGAERAVPALLILPCLPLAFLFGPAGLLLYLALRWIFSVARKES